MTEPTTKPPARAYAVWLVGLLAYAVAVFHRASLGVAGVQAQERFSAGASALSLFLVLQLAVYAAMQVPAGVALDRFGSPALIVAGGPPPAGRAPGVPGGRGGAAPPGGRGVL